MVTLNQYVINLRRFGAFFGVNPLLSLALMPICDAWYADGRQVFTGPPENIRDHVIAASKRLMEGDWRRCADLILG